MPLVGATLKQQMTAALFSAFQREFTEEIAANDQAQAHYQKMANAISDIAMTIVTAIQTEAMVMPGIAVATAGSPAAQTGASVAPGQIM